jgi:hypothetical protein
MMSSVFILAAASAINPADAGIDARLAAGLSVRIEQIRDPVAVEGVQMIVQRATGAGVPQLAIRLEDSWRRQGSEVQVHQGGGWAVRSRIRGSRSEVLQWRDATDSPELLVSIVDLLAPVRTVPSTGMNLPAGCVWSRSVYGQSGAKNYFQRSARCPQSRQRLILQLKRSLETQGWEVLVATDSGMQVRRSGSEGFLSLSDQEGDKSTWVTWLRLESRQ